MGLQRLPWYLKKTLVLSGSVHQTKTLLRIHELHTVCESARCPNISECFELNRATFLIMGNICTRACKFCSIDKGKPLKLDSHEPEHIAKTIKELGITHAVVTSVTRDDLEDSGADHFYQVASEIKRYNSSITVELLTPDFKGKNDAILRVLDADFEIFNHNLETVPSLYKSVRIGANYKRSLDVLNFVKRHKKVLVKSGLMVGLGETTDELKAVLVDLKNAGCDIVTIGQYLMPTLKNIPVHEYIKEPIYREYENYGREIGIKYVYAGPLVRSSYHAQEIKDLIT
ncbi:MAG: lipoyl synthase [Deltaproteobacteria bacterium]|nr:lipoyl synthase [Deltaproteobacteria bacterium]MCL5791570.1 lipoyl synthase [Deltaproteobacteria bacterium]